ncbi:MAG: Gfo/Idh/MocA family oxidoreductase [Verrucomicrobiota bacterium]
MKKVRLGIIGVGSMGAAHARAILKGEVPECELTALCDPAIQNFTDAPDIWRFKDYKELLSSGFVDAVLIATPHYDHTTIGIAALNAGLHVLVEKPISVHKADCERLIAAHKNPKQVFAAMFNQRTDPHYTKVKQMIESGELGTIRRINWIITNWFRSEMYYASGGWRATWAGEGGGVLLNQCPHNLDLFQWMFGMPDEVRAFCQIGRYHHIEVEDDVTAYMQYKNGCTAVFVTSTGEAPGTNRLEIVGEKGRLVVGEGKLEYLRNEEEMSAFSKKTQERFSKPEAWEVTIPIAGGHGPQHLGIMKNFCRAILKGEKLIAPASEGIHSVELANAMLYSSFTKETVQMPLNAKKYEALLKKKISSSTFKKKVVKKLSNDDFSKSFR